jgi:hypothetical protein
VTVTWPQASFAGGAGVSGYVVKRYSNTGAAQTIGSGCSGTVSGLSCTESPAPAGTWRYTVSPKHGNWVGAESAQSAAVTVAAPSLSLSVSVATALPASLPGTIAGFAGGQTVSYRLDDPTTGLALTASTSPSTVPASGSATVSITLALGLATGAHTIYAIGSAGDVASASVSLSLPVSSTIATSAWDLRDASAGSGEVDWTSQTAAADTRTFSTGVWATSFGTKYVEFDMNDALPSGQSVSNAAFNFRFAAAAAGEQACIYFELRRASNGSNISTHGSTSSPAACVTGTTLQTFTTTLGQLTTTALADDVRLRIYGRESAAKGLTVDLATVTGSTPSTSFTLHATRYVDGTGTTPTASGWGPAVAGDGSNYASTANWTNAFSTTKYLKHSFPAYVPTGATVKSATLKNYYRATAAGHTVCWYFDLYAGSTPIATYGSSSAPVSCNSTTSYSTDSVSIAEVNTPARANSLSVRAYYNISGSGTRTTQHDLVSLSVTYEQ